MMASYSGMFDVIRRPSEGKGRVRAEGLSRISWESERTVEEGAQESCKAWLKQTITFLL